MRRNLSALAAATLASVTLAAPLPLLAQTAPTQTTAPAAPMSDEARTALHAEIRAYLLQNPEVIFEAVAEFERRTAAAQAGMDTALVEINADQIFADGYSFVGGNPDGSITLVEFMDYRCGYCRRAWPEVLDFIGTDGDVRLIIKEFPILGPQSELMSRFAVAVHQLGGDAPYYAAHRRLIAWDGEATPAALGELAAELGLDGAAVIARMDSAEVSQVLGRNRALAERLQISGTPSFVMGDGARGEMLRGMVPSRELERAAQAMRG